MCFDHLTTDDMIVNFKVHSSKERLVVTRIEPRSYRWLKNPKNSSVVVRNRGTKPNSSMISRLSSRLSSLASSGPLYLGCTGTTPHRGSPVKEAT